MTETTTIPPHYDGLVGLVPTIQAIMPPGDARRFIMQASSLIAEPRIQACTTESVLGTIQFAAEIGLPPGGPLGQLHVTVQTIYDPKTGEKVQIASPVLGYQGLIKLATNSGDYDTISGVIVREGDEFEQPWDDETGTHFKLKPGKPGERGDIIGVIGRATVKGTDRAEVAYLTVEEIRELHMPLDPPAHSPWVTHWEAMVKKTGVRAVSKYTTKSIQATPFAQAMSADEAIVTLSADGTLAIDHKPRPHQDWPALIAACDDKADLEALYQRIGREEAPRVVDEITPLIYAQAVKCTTDTRPHQPTDEELAAAHEGQAA